MMPIISSKTMIAITIIMIASMEKAPGISLLNESILLRYELKIQKKKEFMTVPHYLRPLLVRHQWLLTPIIVATWEAKVERIADQSQPEQIIFKTPPPK
jgi:hypothetical protein